MNCGGKYPPFLCFKLNKLPQLKDIAAIEHQICIFRLSGILKRIIKEFALYFRVPELSDSFINKAACLSSGDIK